jgi:predicted outer membrane repeat protein
MIFENNVGSFGGAISGSGGGSIIKLEKKIPSFNKTLRSLMAPSFLFIAIKKYPLQVPHLSRALQL